MKQKIIKTLSFILTFSIMSLNASDQSHETNDSHFHAFSKEELSNLIDNEIELIKNESRIDTKKFDEIKQTTMQQLSDYKVTGCSFAIDPNLAFFWDTQNPSFKVTYKNSNGDIRTRTYNAKIKSIGWKFEFTFKFNFIFFLGTDLNFYNTDKEIELGFGIDLGSRFLDITYANFKNAPGGILIVGIPVPQVLSIKQNILNIFQFIFNNSAFSETITKQYEAQLKALGIDTQTPKEKQRNEISNTLKKQNKKAQSDLQQLSDDLQKLSDNKIYQLQYLGLDCNIVIGGSLTPVE